MAKKHGKMWKMIASNALRPDEARAIMEQKGANKLRAKLQLMVTDYQNKIPQMVQQYANKTGQAVEHYSIIGFASPIVSSYRTAMTTYAANDYKLASATMGQEYARAAPEIPAKWAHAWGAIMFGARPTPQPVYSALGPFFAGLQQGQQGGGAATATA